MSRLNLPYLILPAVFTALLLFGLSVAAQTEDLPKIKAPDFEVRHVDSDQKLRLSDYAGQVVLLNFWASWCYPCLVEMPEFQKIYDKFKDKGFSVLAVAVFDQLTDARAFQDKQQFTYPVLFDHEEQAKNAFQVEVVPQTFLVGRDGMLVPIPDSKTGESKLWINDVTVWSQPETYDFLTRLIEGSP